MNLLSIDPSVRGTGIALFQDNILTRTVLWDTGLQVRTEAYGVIAKRALGFVCDMDIPSLDGIICEVPQVYRKGGGDPNDLIAVAMVAGALCATIPATKITTVWPAAWKGQIPKGTHHKRIQKYLRPDELAMLEITERKIGAGFHNIMDAVGLGLWHLQKTASR